MEKVTVRLSHPVGNFLDTTAPENKDRMVSNLLEVELVRTPKVSNALRLGQLVEVPTASKKEVEVPKPPTPATPPK